MRFSTFSILDRYPELNRSPGVILEDCLRSCEQADEAGFDAFWVGEHHFRDFGTLPNPAVLLAAAATRTRRIRLGPAVAVLPFRHPLIVAEDYAIVDQLSGGRLNLGVGSGAVPWELEGFGVRPDQKAVWFDEALACLRAALRGESAKASGRHVNVPDVRPNMPMAQTGGPPIYIATNRPAAAYRAGARGDHLLTMVSTSLEDPGEIAVRLGEYRRGRADGGHDPDSGDAAVVVLAHVAGSDEEARARTEDRLGRFARTHESLTPDESAGLYERMRARGTGIFGSVSSAADRLAPLVEAGTRHVVFWLDFGGIPPDVHGQTLRQIAAELRPKWTERAGEPRTG